MHLSLTLPDSPHNARLGVLTLHSTFAHHDTAIARSTHSFLPPYRSRLVRLARSALRLPLYALGWWSELTSVDVTLYTDYTEPPATLHSTHLNVTLSSPNASQLHVVAGRLSIVAKLSGVRWLMHTWYLTSAVVGIALLWAGQVALGVVVIGVMCMRGWWTRGDEDDVLNAVDSWARVADAQGMKSFSLAGAGSRPAKLRDAAPDSAPLVEEKSAAAVEDYRLEGEAAVTDVLGSAFAAITAEPTLRQRLAAL